jgi:cell division protein FtsB
MSQKYKVIGGLSRKAKFNTTMAIVLLFIIIIVFASINQVKQIVEKRKEIEELEEKLTWQRSENIRLLAAEKTLYLDEGIEIEARKQFNMSYEGEENIYVVIDDSQADTAVIENVDMEYSRNDLWGNIKLFYEQEIMD